MVDESVSPDREAVPKAGIQDGGAVQGAGISNILIKILGGLNHPPIRLGG
jgi:hypothetical protein